MTVIIICCLVLVPTPVIMAVCGRWFTMSPPEPGNVGYRSDLSVKNADTWLTAHRLCGRYWSRACIAAFAVIPVYGAISAALGLGDSGSAWIAVMAAEAVQITLLLAALPVTEKGLKKIFYPDGRRK